MNFRQFALTNLKRNTRSYAAYFLSSAFSITIFFMYAAFIFHPDIIAGTLDMDAASSSPSREAMQGTVIIAEWIIFAFSFIFVLYSMNAFLHSRKKEFGLLSLLGITKGQLNKLIFIENNIIGLFAIAVGILTGTLFFKLFLMAVSAAFSLPATLPFIIAPKAIFVTAGLFFLLFEVICFITLFTVRNNNISELLYSIKKPKKYPAYSMVLSVISLLTIGTGYYLAYQANLFEMIVLMIPITALVTFGTYFLFTQCSILVIRLLQKRRSSYLRSTNLLTVSDLAFKLKDNARVLFIVSILSAVAFTSSGVLFSIVKNMEAEVEARYPQSIALSTATNLEAYNKAKQQLTKALQDKGIAYEGREMKLMEARYLFNPDGVKTPLGITFNTDKEETGIHLLSEDDYNAWARFNDKKTVDLREKQALYVPPTPDEGVVFYTQDRIKISIDQRSYVLEMGYSRQQALAPMPLTSETLIVSKEIYKQIEKGHNPENDVTYYGIHLPDWRNNVETILDISQNITLEKGLYFDSRADMMKIYKSTFHLPFFIGFFISALFFLAAASILYFRLYNEIDNDLIHYHALYRIGLTQAEMKSIITKQILLLFLAPFVVAVFHAGFAFKALNNMLAGSVAGPSITIISAFFALQMMYFFVVRTLYFKKLKQVM
ncbi:MAG: FtsX-like permease family protein [Bacillus sp. (in: firmicutes)]